MWSMRNGQCWFYQPTPTSTHYRTHKFQIFDWQTYQTMWSRQTNYSRQFFGPQKGRSKLVCPIYEMLFIQDLNWTTTELNSFNNFDIQLILFLIMMLDTSKSRITSLLVFLVKYFNEKLTIQLGGTKRKSTFLEQSHSNLQSQMLSACSS